MIKAPLIDNFIRIMDEGDFLVNKETQDIIDRIFMHLHRIKACGQDERRELWIKAERGKIGDYGDYEDFKYDEEVSSYEEFENLWLSEYPDEHVWYHLVTVEQDTYKGIFLGRKLIYQSEVNRLWPPVSSYENDLTALFSWMEEAVKEAISKVYDGSYNADVAENLPAIHRTGTITRADFWKELPEYKEDYLADISEEEIQTFLAYISEQSSEDPVGEYLSEISAVDFYKFCSLGYAANKYERIKDITSPKKQYYRMADGRDDGLSDLDENDTKAFADWLENRKWHGGHPWEVCAGGNSTHIDLYVMKNEKGYYLALRGKSYGRSIETVKFYNALRKEGMAVCLLDAEGIAARFTESDKIGIVPEGVFPRYCESWFPGEEILDFMNLPYEAEEKDKILPYITWLPETMTEPMTSD